MKTSLHWAAHIACLFCLLWAADRVYVDSLNMNILTERVLSTYDQFDIQKERADSLSTALKAARYNGYTYAQHNGGKGAVLAFTHYLTRPVSVADCRFADSMYHALAPSVAWEDSLHARK